jgi:Ni,Fe-hydrogenase III small subunit
VSGCSTAARGGDNRAAQSGDSASAARGAAAPVTGAALDGRSGEASQERRAAAELRARVASQFGRSLHIRTLDTGSCAACEQEIRLLAAPHYDLHRLGFFFTPAPRHADLLMVTGPMIRAFDVAARKTFDAMPGPKIVVATGACALGGVYPADAFTHGGIGDVLPVDVWIPGCPPSPLALLQGLLVAVDRLAEKVTGLTFSAGVPAEEVPG